MTVPADVCGLSGAAYEAAKAKALRPVPFVAPPVAPRVAVTDQTEAEYLAAKPKTIREMTPAEYAAAKRAAMKSAG